MISRPMISIRRGAYVDFADILDIQSRAFNYAWSTESLRREMDHHWSTLLIAARVSATGLVGSTLGFSVFWSVADEIQILNIATDPAHQRQGVGAALLDAILKQGQQHHCVTALLEVRRSNQPAIALYLSRGFTTTGLRKNYYTRENEDAVLMSYCFNEEVRRKGDSILP